MLCRTVSSLQNLCTQRHLCVKIATIHIQQKLFSAKPPRALIQKNSDGEPHKRPKQKPQPKITLIASDESISVITLEEAQQLSKRRDLKLVKITDLDTKSQRPIYKLMTGSEYHAEELKQKEQRKKEIQSGGAFKGEKLLMLNAGINKHDLETNVKKIQKWISKMYEVRVVINGDASNMEKTETVYKFLENNLKEQSRFLQKRAKGNDLKFQIVPPKDTENSKKPL